MSNQIFENAIYNMEIHHPDAFKDLDWGCISSYRFLSIDFIYKYSNLLIWKILIVHQNLKGCNLGDYKNSVKPRSPRKYLSNFEFEKQIINMELYYPESFKDIDWACISSYRFLSEEFIDRYSKYLIWNVLLLNQKLSECIIRKYVHKINFKTLICSAYNKVSVDFLVENRDNISLSDFRVKSELLAKKGKLSYDYDCYRHDFDYIKDKTGIIDDDLLIITVAYITKYAPFDCECCCIRYKECPF